MGSLRFGKHSHLPGARPILQACMLEASYMKQLLYLPSSHSVSLWGQAWPTSLMLCSHSCP